MSAYPAVECNALEGLFRIFRDFDHVVLAVSGGPDSLALMHLAARWAATAAPPCPRLSVITVDHGLRPESAAEADFVAEAARGAGLEHVKVKWTDARPRSGLQAAARDARIRLIAEHVSGFPTAAVAFAHHRDDQTETVLMRLGRGSGVDGLAAMRPVTKLGTLTVLRPLLDVPKAALIATLEQNDKSWCEDPSNANGDFERVRLRQSGAVLGQIGLSSAALVRTARRAARAADALEAVTDKLAADAVDLNGGAYAALPWNDFTQAPSEVAIRLLRRLVTAYGGQDEPCRLSRVETVYEALLAKPAGQTLGGCIVGVVGGTMRIMREPDRSALEHVAIEPGFTVLWDRRFSVQPMREMTAPATVRSIGQEGLAEIRARMGGGMKFALPRQVLLGLPSIWRDGALVALPAIEGVAPASTAGYDTFPALFLNEGMVMSGNSMPTGRHSAPA